MTTSSERYSHSITQACELMGFSRMMVYRLINSGQLRTFKVNNRRFISDKALKEFIANCEKRTEQA